MPFAAPPAFAAFEHREARAGFEVAFLRAEADAVLVEGSTSAVEEGEPWTVAYSIELDTGWRTRRALIRGRSRLGATERTVEGDGHGRWTVDGRPEPALDGCLDVDLESSSLTNAFPVRRLGLAEGHAAQAPAAYVRAVGLAVERLEQRYERIADGSGGRERYAYRAPAFGFACELEYDASGVVLAYPGIAVRSG